MDLMIFSSSEVGCLLGSALDSEGVTPEAFLVLGSDEGIWAGGLELKGRTVGVVIR